MLHLIYWASGLTLLLAQLYLSLRRPASPGRPRAAEVAWAIVPVAILVWLGVLSHRASPPVAAGHPQAGPQESRDVRP